MREIMWRERRYLKPYLWLVRRHVDHREYGRASWWLSELLAVGEGNPALQGQAANLLETTDVRMRERGKYREPPEDLPAAKAR
jgi:hypothetical protein